MTNNPALGEWLLTECAKRGVSMSEASRKAGVAPNTISEIYNGSAVGLRRIKALARYFDVSPDFLLRLAGWLPPKDDLDDEDAVLRAKALELERRWKLLRKERPDLVDTLINMAFMQAELAESSRSGAESQTEENFQTAH